MNRREFLQGTGALGVATLASTKPTTPRQVVVIMGESVRADMLNCARHTGLKTPNLDRLASSGVRFERAYDCQPVCAPARSAAWTGLYPHSNGVWANSLPLGSTVHTIGQHLNDRGVHCAFVGKWHLDGFDYFGTGRPAPGWDPAYWYDMRDYLSELSPADRERSRKMATGQDPTWKAEDCYAYRCTNRAVDFLAKNRNSDFLFVLAYDEPHGPSLCPKEYSDAYKGYHFPAAPNVNDTLVNKPAEQRVWAAPRLGRQQPPIEAHQYFGSHTFVDAQMGRVLDAIDKFVPGAMVLYTADHGVFLESHRLTDKGAAMYDEITRIPFLVRWPGVAPVGAVCQHPVSQIDLSGTLMEFFGHDVPKTMEGKSMLATLRNPKVKPREEIFIEWGRYEVDHDGFGGFQPIRCVCDGRFKLSIHLMTSDELYDLENDPGELDNLIESPEHAELRNHLHDRLLRWMNETRDPFRGYAWGHRSWRPSYPERWENDGMTRQRESDGYLPRELDYDTGLPMVNATRPK